jgi:hypothetical protein
MSPIEFSFVKFFYRNGFDSELLHTPIAHPAPLRQSHIESAFVLAANTRRLESSFPSQKCPFAIFWSAVWGPY